MRASAYGLAGVTGLVLLLILPLVTALQACDSLRHQQKMLNAQVLQLLGQMGPSLPPECVAQVAAFNFPAKKLKVKEPRPARRAAYEMLRGLLGLLSSSPVQMGWTPSAHERLLGALHAQSEGIKRCSEEEKTESQNPDESRNKLVLLRYFRGIRTLLQDKSRSLCAGTVVQLGVRTCLTYLDMLINSISS